ncbi:triphosphoribosyl-dephospho-CoA synthase [Ramlibacter albus]|uniref:triphosphoribosyl-dephospho-CoA synthase n=1 Tax=Ramlibacter albus TaxID=2079448 RepID=A0A923MA06_9BURK|nr:triphosphoribosyl-dephospho-CoA synthase [Ramlibacter albus]MBC5766396.1 triphosphoribosyl-dephospho-CoA synthase [Ramlibacter albus]
MDTRVRLNSRAVAEAACQALHDELALETKPGLVSFVDSGSHTDMDAGTFLRSIGALRPFFTTFAELGAQRAHFRALELQGVRAEAAMLDATCGVNTHRGAIFILGLLCAAVGWIYADGEVPTANEVRRTMLDAWGADLARRANVARESNGSRAAQRFGLRSISVEAAQGFPVLFDKVLPALGSVPTDTTRTDALFAAITVLDDTTVVHRGGIQALVDVKRIARDFLAQGGAAATGARELLRDLHRQFVARRISPGGAADMLSAACFLQATCVASASNALDPRLRGDDDSLSFPRRRESKAQLAPA